MDNTDPYNCNRDDHENVQWVADPFMEEIYDETEYVWLCDFHYRERRDEI